VGEAIPPPAFQASLAYGLSIGLGALLLLCCAKLAHLAFRRPPRAPGKGQLPPTEMGGFLYGSSAAHPLGTRTTSMLLEEAESARRVPPGPAISTQPSLAEDWALPPRLLAANVLARQASTGSPRATGLLRRQASSGRRRLPSAVAAPEPPKSSVP